MADKEVKISIQTTADTSGAKAAEVALDDVADKGKELDAALKTVDGDELKKIPPAAKAAEGSIEQLENEVQRLQSELAKMPVGSSQFITMAGKVNAAKKSLEDAHVEAKKFGATVGRGGSAGAAVLELSRGFEDAQYGIRGVLNNIPGLVLALGGTGGLAGVISLVAVAGSLLWERFGNGAKDAKKPTKDIVDTYLELLKVFQDIEALGKGDREKAAEQQAKAIKDSLSGIEATAKLNVGNDQVEAARAAAAATLKLAQDKLELARIEAKIVTATGEDSVKFTKERELIIKRIYQDELKIVEIQRQAAIDAAERKLGEAQGKNSITTQAVTDAMGKTAALAAEINRLQAEADGAGGKRIELIEEQQNLTEAIKSLEIAWGKALTSDEQVGIEGKIDAAKKRRDVEIPKEEKELRNKQEGLTAQAEAKRPEMEGLIAGQAAATEAQNASAKAMLDASLALQNLKLNQSIGRQSEADLKQVADTGALEKGKRDAGEKTSKEVGQVVTAVETQLGDVANQPDVKAMLDQVKALAADGVQAGEQNEVVKLVGTLVSKIKDQGDGTAKIMRDLYGVVDRSVTVQNAFTGQIAELKSKVFNLEQAAKNPK